MKRGTLVQDTVIVTMEGGKDDVIHGDILIEGDEIRAIGLGLSSDCQDLSAIDIVDGRTKIVLPGLINAHMHTWQTALRSVGSNWTLPEYFRWMHAGLATRFRPRDVYVGTLAGALNQLDCGTTTLVDWCHNNPTPEHTDAAIAALRESGIRAAFFHGTPKPEAGPGQRPFWEIPHPKDEVRRLHHAFDGDRGMLSLGLAVLGPHYATMDVTLHDFALARDYGLIASMHQGGGPSRNPDGWARLRTEGLLGSFTNIVHGNDLSDALLAELVDQEVTFTITPESELICGHGHPILGRLRDLGAWPSIGIDIESAHSGDMLLAARMALSHQRSLDNGTDRDCGTLGGKCRLRARDALGWITIEGARMLGQDHRIGSLKVGKQADLLLLETNALNLQPIHDPISSVVMQSNASNIDSVMVAGTWRKRNGKLLCPIDMLIEELRISGNRISREVGMGRADLV